VEYYNAQGLKKVRKLGLLQTRVFLHEYDHLDGIKMKSRAETVESNLVLIAYRKFIQRYQHFPKASLKSHLIRSLHKNSINLTSRRFLKPKKTDPTAQRQGRTNTKQQIPERFLTKHQKQVHLFLQIYSNSLD
jgi:hypothetical protein